MGLLSKATVERLAREMIEKSAYLDRKNMELKARAPVLWDYINFRTAAGDEDARTILHQLNKGLSQQDILDGLMRSSAHHHESPFRMYGLETPPRTKSRY